MSQAASPQPVGSATQPSLWTRSFVAITAVNFLIFIGFHMLNAPLALYVESLGASEALIGIVTSAATVAAIIVRPLVGAALDKFGRKGLFLSGILGLCVAVAAIPWVPLLGVIMALRTLQGVFWAIANTSASTVAADVIPKSRFGEGIGYFGLSSGVAMTFAPALSLALYYGGGITPPMLISATVLLIAFFVAMTLKYQKGTKDIKTVGAAPPSVVSAGDVDATTDVAPPTHTHIAVTPPSTLASLSLPSKLFERKALLPAFMGFFSLCGFGAVQSFIAVYVGHIGIDGIELYFLSMAVLMLASRPLFGMIIDKKGYSIPMVIGLVAIALGFILLSQVDSRLLLMTCAALFGFGFGAVNPTLQTMAVAEAKPERRGIATATFFVGFDGGIAAGTIMAGTIAGFIGYANMYLLAISLPLITGVLYLTIGRKRRRQV